MTFPLPLITSIVLIATLPGGASQEPERLLPAALVERLIGSQGGPGGVRIEEGLPADFPAELLPDGARPRLSMTSQGSDVVLAEAVRFDDADRARYARGLAAAGWKDFSQVRGQGGFMASPEGPAETYCRDRALASLTVSPGRDGRVWVRVSVMSFAGVRCGEPPDARMMSASIFEDARMPALVMPAGARMTSMSGAAGDDYNEQVIRLETALTPAAAADHYSGIVTARGWIAEGKAEVEGLSLVRFAAPLGPANRPVPALLSAMSLPDGTLSVTMRVFVSAGR